MHAFFETGFAELLTSSNFSFLSAASHPKELVERAAELGLSAIGLSDECSLSGVVRAHEAAKEHGIHLLVGARFRPKDGLPIALYARDHAGYTNLCRLISRGRRRAPKGQYTLYLGDFAEFSAGLLAIVLPLDGERGSSPDAPRGSRSKTPGSHLGDTGEPDYAPLSAFRAIYGEHCFLAINRRLGANDPARLAQHLELSDATGVPLVASNDVRFHIPERQALQDVVTCIREGCTLDDAGYRLNANAEAYLKSEVQMLRLFAGHEDLVTSSVAIARRCTFSLDELRYEYPEGISPEGVPIAQFLRDETYRGARRRYPLGIPAKVTALLEKELALISELNYEAYFLTIYEIVSFARSKNILCQGRGSAANSAVCYCLGITSVDPAHHELLFERFISKERNEPPDIDIDFENKRREEVYQHIYEKYGRERAGLTAVIITYRRRSALREIGKVMGLSRDQLDALSRHVDTLNDPVLVEERLKQAGLSWGDPRVRMTIALTRELRGFPRHLSQHVGGFVITRGKLDELCPIENASMDGRTVLQWDKDDLDALNILKVDCLALGMLTALQKAFALIQRHQGISHDMAGVLRTDVAEDTRLPPGQTRMNTPVYDMICAGDTVGVFQIESRAQMQMLPRLRPRTFYDLVIEVAIIRPGPIQGGMVHPFLRRRRGLEPIVYPHPSCEPVLKKTLGVPLFQEQVMQLAIVVGGYTGGEADQLRKAMAAWKRDGRLEKHRERLVAGMQAKGIELEYAERLFDQIRGFSSYGFPESHAASFALIVYVSCFLKRYYPAAFCCAVVNSMPMGFYSVSSLVRDAREHGVEVRAPDINASHYDCTLEELVPGVPEADKPESWGCGGPCLRLGFSQISGMKEEVADAICAERTRGGRFRSMDDLLERITLDRGTLEALAEADAFLSLGVSRRQALWQVQSWQALPPLLRGAGVLPSNRRDESRALEALPTMSLAEEVLNDYTMLGLSLRAHPLALLRERLGPLGVVPSSELASVPNGRFVEIAGIVLCRQRPGTASGVLFITLEDECGVANIIVWPKIFEEFRTAARLGRMLRIRGEVQRDDTGVVTNVIASRLIDLADDLRTDRAAVQAGAHTRSRDFH